MTAAFHRTDGPRRVEVDRHGTAIGGDDFLVIAGPCAVEDREGLLAIASSVRAGGAGMLRGGAWKPRTSPRSFQGMGVGALELLVEARAATGLPVVTEVLDPRDADVAAAAVDVLQVGARNMSNGALLRELARTGRPILLKRGFGSTIDELLAAAEYVLEEGNEDILLVERGIRTFERSTRFTLDISAVPVLKARTHLPVVVDPSHPAGDARYVAALARAAVAVGADGVMLEVHGDPANAQSDGEQSLQLEAFAPLIGELDALLAVMGRRRSVPGIVGASASALASAVAPVRPAAHA